MILWLLAAREGNKPEGRERHERYPASWAADKQIASIGIQEHTLKNRLVLKVDDHRLTDSGLQRVVAKAKRGGAGGGSVLRSAARPRVLDHRPFAPL